VAEILEISETSEDGVMCRVIREMLRNTYGETHSLAYAVPLIANQVHIPSRQIGVNTES
jgi:hypothetical protein